MEETRFKMVKSRHKESFVGALDECKVDEKLVSLCKFVSETENFFTSSGCAGRILLLGLPRHCTKREAYFHRKWHRKVKVSEVKEALKEKTQGEIWLKQEPFILHIGCKTIEHAKKILEVMRKTGIKRGGIIVGKKGKFLIELQGTQSMSLPVKDDGKFLVDDDYLEYLCTKANEKLSKNYKSLEEFEKTLKKELI